MYSQHNEEDLIKKFLPRVIKGKYIDIGAGETPKDSNTYKLYLEGWRGLLVEPLPSNVEAIRKYRPEDILFDGIVADYIGKSAMSYTVAANTQFFEEYKSQYDTYSVNTTTIDSLLNAHPEFYECDLLSLDIEGAEKWVLERCDFEKFKPTLLIIEYKLREVDQRSNWEHFLVKHYQLITFIGSNAVYMRKEAFNAYCAQQNWKIPQCEPLIGSNVKEAMSTYMANPGFLTEYKQTTKFEEEISKYLGVKHTIVVNNGTISLSLALLAMGVKRGDKVIVPNLTMIATPNAVSLIGAEPVFVDVTPDLLLDHAKAWELILKDPSIKAAIFVSLNGRWWGSKAWDFVFWCKRNGIALIEDAAQSFGSRNYELYQIGGRWFDISSFSFSMPKIITTGQGGCLVTHDDTIATNLRRLKDFGRTGGGNDIHDVFGINCKFTEMQAVVGLAQLEDIHERTKRKKYLYQLYRELLTSVPQVQFIPTNLDYTVPWFVDIFVDAPADLAAFLKKCGIGTRAIYPPINNQKVYQGQFNSNATFPVTSEFTSKGLWLPSSLTLSDEQVSYICTKIKEYYGK